VSVLPLKMLVDKHITAFQKSLIRILYSKLAFFKAKTNNFKINDLQLYV
jgi:hypothetical protein